MWEDGRRSSFQFPNLNRSEHSLFRCATKIFTMSKKKKSRDPEPMDDGGDYGMYEQKVVIQEDPIHGQLELTDKELETDVS